MKNLVLTFSLLFAGLLALSPVAVHQARANAAPATVTAVSTGMPPGSLDVEASYITLSGMAMNNNDGPGAGRRILAWVARQTCRATAWLNHRAGSTTDAEYIEDLMDCHAIRAS